MARAYSCPQGERAADERRSAGDVALGKRAEEVDALADTEVPDTLFLLAVGDERLPRASADPADADDSNTTT